MRPLVRRLGEGLYEVRRVAPRAAAGRLTDTVRMTSRWTIRRWADEASWRAAGGVGSRAAGRGPLAVLRNPVRDPTEHLVDPHGAELPPVSTWPGNLALNEGLQQIIDDIAGLATPTKWNAANARVGVGDSAVAEAATQTGLQGATTAFKAMDATFPSRSAQTGSWRGTFGGAEGNQVWAEFTIDSGAVALINMNRKVSAQGTKTSGQTWELTESVAFS